MGYKKSLDDAVRYTLKAKTCFGESRHQAKLDGSDKDRIFSFNTWRTYTRECLKFVHFCEERFNSKTLNDCRSHLNEYVQEMRSNNASAYSQKCAVASVGKMYNHSFFKEVETDARHRNTITRGRLPGTENEKHFSEEKNKELVNFCRCTGLRRSELQNIKGDCLRERDGQYYIHIEKGKGGKSSNRLIIGNNQDVIDKIKNTPNDMKVWGKVNPHANIHSYRADYCNSVYNLYARPLETLSSKEIYHCRGDMKGRCFDKAAMRICSENMSHNRIDVIAGHYLR